MEQRDLLLTRECALAALEQLNSLCAKTLNYEMCNAVSNVYNSILDYDLEHVPLAGMMFNLMCQVDNELQFVSPPQTCAKKVSEFAGFQLTFAGDDK